jgi:hypothetical protein
MQKNTPEIEEHSINDFNSLIELIKTQTGLNEEAVAKRMGYNEGYISQTRSRGKVSNKLINSLKREFGIGLQNANKKVFISHTADVPDIDFIQKTIDRMLTDRERAITVIEQMATLLVQKNQKDVEPAATPEPGSEGTVKIKERQRTKNQ